MKVLVLYRPQSEHGRKVDEFLRDFSWRNPAAKTEVMNVDSREGMAMVSLYDITSYPAIMTLREDGSASMVWQGDMLPLMDEVAGYATY